MVDYNLYGLNPRDFQQLVQAIARKQLSAGVTAFGDGKDGARDLTYRGKMNYPSPPTSTWDGYLVLGCKFLQKPIEDTVKEADWAIAHLTKDLDKFLDLKRNLPKPDYYIFVTNISLTGTANTGGHDRVTKLLNDYTQKLHLKGSGYWDYNALRGFLDADQDIRITYGHFIVTGDVLSQMMKWLKFHSTNFIEVIHAVLQKELLADMSAKLQSAGEDPDLQIPLANVFVDLPITTSSEAAVLPQKNNDKKQVGAVQFILNVGSQVLRQRFTDEEINNQDLSLLASVNSRFVIVGGPGQGKSTIGQYLCQIYRAAILKDRPKNLLEPQIPNIIYQLEMQRKTDGCLPNVRRFPIRIELKAYSQALIDLSNNTSLTLLNYIRHEIARLGNASVRIEDMKHWLGAYPWLIVLDGLDEVPPSSNRSAVMRQIEDFQVDAVSQNADILIVITTRPQSYSKEFSSKFFQHLYLTPLSSSQALQYGERLVQSRCGSDERRQEELLRSLKKACENEATSRLMQSPLQVTIMATLLEETGEPPQQRYKLFAEYYRTIYKRETRRKLLSGILSERQTDIDVIHAQAGLLLHAMGEIALRPTRKAKRKSSEQLTESAFSDDQFRELVHRRLKKIGLTEPKESLILESITDGSLQRLVFLVRPKDGWVRFDITSLKEFMAAESIVSGPDNLVKKRLEIIAPNSYWRNVFLFAVGKCFTDKEYLLDRIVAICENLNSIRLTNRILNDYTMATVAKATLWGSRLALDILSDGTARQHPEYELRLAKLALFLIKIPDTETTAHLASIYNNDLLELFQETVNDELEKHNFQQKYGSWQLLMNLADRNIQWAEELIQKNWPKDPEQQATLLFSRGTTLFQKWSTIKLMNLVPLHPPEWFQTNLLRHSGLSLHIADLPKIDDPPNWWIAVIRIIVCSLGGQLPNSSLTIDYTNPFFLQDSNINLQLTLSSLSNEHNSIWHGFHSFPLSHSGWAPYISAARFADTPDMNTLAKELSWLATCWDTSFKNRNELPWPLAACLTSANNSTELNLLAQKALDGQLGSTVLWKKAEQRWCENGITDKDLHFMTNECWPFNDQIATIGFPLANSTASLSDTVSTMNPTVSSTIIQGIAEILQQLPENKMSDFIASVTRRFISATTMAKIAPMQLRRIIERNPDWTWMWLKDFSWPKNYVLQEEWLDLFDWLGRQNKFIYLLGTSQTEHLIHHFSIDPERRPGLLPILATLARHNFCSLSEEVLKQCETWGKEAEVHCTLLRLVRTDIDTMKMKQMARFLAANATTESVHDAVTLLKRLGADHSIAFVLELLNLLDNKDILLKQEILEFLLEYMVNKPSLLTDVNKWKELQLPKQV